MRPDAVTQRLQQHADTWCSIVGWSDQQVAERIRQDAIDILVDLAGHTANNRLLVFARKPRRSRSPTWVIPTPPA